MTIVPEAMHNQPDPDPVDLGTHTVTGPALYPRCELGHPLAILDGSHVYPEQMDEHKKLEIVLGESQDECYCGFTWSLYPDNELYTLAIEFTSVAHPDSLADDDEVFDVAKALALRLTSYLFNSGTYGVCDNHE